MSNHGATTLIVARNFIGVLSEKVVQLVLDGDRNCIDGRMAVRDLMVEHGRSLCARRSLEARDRVSQIRNLRSRSLDRCGLVGNSRKEARSEPSSPSLASMYLVSSQS